MAHLFGDDTPVHLDGYTLRAPGVRGEVSVMAGGAERGGAPLLSEVFEAALRGAAVEEARTLHLMVESQRTNTPDIRGEAPDLEGSAVELFVPAHPGFAYVVLSVHEEGVVSWHFPSGPGTAGSVTRGVPSGQVFHIPVLAPTQSVTLSERGIVTALAGQVLKVLFYPLVESATLHLASRWEAEHRPHRLRPCRTDDVVHPMTGALVEPARQALVDGPALLLIHGTFSRTDAAFGALGGPVLDELHRRYGGRVFALDHPSMTVDPDVNAQWCVSELPPGQVTLDILAHSRGGLVARALAQELASQGRGRVRKLVLCGTPNAGTALANPEHMVGLLNRLSTLLNLAPPGADAVCAVLESILVAVKLVGQAALESLEGLAAMRPGGAYLERLDRFSLTGTDLYVLASNYEPRGGLRQLVWYARDAVRDVVFGQTTNDLVVPTQSVAACLPVTERLEFQPQDAISHSAFFKEERSTEALLRWLTNR